ncbi:MAG: hypothetical protein JWQ74_661 [Marmoricola sp.]|nr:hypothetical protein [Marmoricola sp.]
MSTHVYTGRATNWPSVVICGVLLVPLIGMALPTSSPSTGAVVLVVALVGFLAEVITASDVRATSGPQGVTVHWGLLGWPRARYALDDIEDASVAEVPWYLVTFGFWWTPGRTVCTVRSGPALRLRLRSGRIVTITVPEPYAAVAALNANRPVVS